MTVSAIEEPSRIDIIVVIGDSFNRVLEVENDDLSPAKLSAFSATAVLIDPDNGETLATFSIPELQDDGEIPLLLKVSQTEELKPGTVEWFVTLIGEGNPDASTTTVIAGDCQIRKRKSAA